ncbi:MAG: hypothetical protein H0X14_08615 [Acidobacteria bacterium]|nr:hypothetical protein [Acidobacteriota bacterium]
MRNRLRWRAVCITRKAFCLINLLVFACAFTIKAEETSSNILCRPELAPSRRSELADKLRAITGWRDLGFDQNGALRPGRAQSSGGSPTARDLLGAAVTGKNVLILEDASNRSDVVFCRVNPGRWTKDAAQRPPAYVILIDFADFSRITGDRAALAAFNVGWGLLHEIDHVVHDSVDPQRIGEAGECEDLINRMRRECGLAERVEYYFTLVPGTTASAFMTRLVRLAFEQRTPEQNKKKKRYWLVWDASLVGGFSEDNKIAAVR